MIAKQMEVRSNIKKFFDLAYEGEAVIIPRKQNRNVVIISETEYNRLRALNRVSLYKEKVSDSGRSGINLEHNLEKLDKIRGLGRNWNGNDAPAFSPEMIDRAEHIIEGLAIQPEVFPTALGTIQLEYDNSRRDHMEIEIGEGDVAGVFVVLFNGEEEEETIPALADDINRRVGEFYG